MPRYNVSNQTVKCACKNPSADLIGPDGTVLEQPHTVPFDGTAKLHTYHCSIDGRVGEVKWIQEIPVPEPSGTLMLLVGCGVLAMMRRKP